MFLREQSTEGPSHSSVWGPGVGVSDSEVSFREEVGTRLGQQNLRWRGDACSPASVLGVLTRYCQNEAPTIGIVSTESPFPGA